MKPFVYAWLFVVSVILSRPKSESQECRMTRLPISFRVLVSRVGALLVTALIAIFPVFAIADQRPRVFITDSESWEIVGSAGGSGGSFAASTRGGARPQTAEIIKTFGERCQQVLVNNKQEKSDYVVVLDHEGGKGYLRRRNKVAVFNKDGDAIVSRSTRSLGNSVQDACEAIVADWPGHQTAAAASAQVKPVLSPTKDTVVTAPGVAGSPQNNAQIQLASVTAATSTSANAAVFDVSSSPPGADIEIDGEFSGNTPSSINLGAGQHTVRISKKGYIPWERTIRSSAGNVRIAAELETRQTSVSASESPTAPANQAAPTASAPTISPALPLRPAGMTSTEAPPTPAPSAQQETKTGAPTEASPSVESEGTASVTSNPDGAEIFVDSSGRGHTPALLKLKAGKHKIQLAANGYKDWVAEIEVKGGSIVNVTGNLEK